MTDDELQAHIKAIEEALANGEIEERLASSSEWNAPDYRSMVIAHMDVCKPEYRIKPKPFECWVILDGTCIVGTEYIEEMAHRRTANYPNGRVIKTREVTDDEVS